MRAESRRNRVGLVVNPIAGMGGAVGLKGTDGPHIVAEAIRRNAEPHAGPRAQRALAALIVERPRIDIVTVPGVMGGDWARAAGAAPILVGEDAGEQTKAAHTCEAARQLLQAGVDLLLFAGGDGTARDILDVVGEGVPTLGVPTGVKMQSAVFAISPVAAGRCAARFLDPSSTGSRVALRDAEVMDLDEEALRSGRLSARLYGMMRVPYERTLLQSAKSGGSGPPDALLRAACSQLARALEPDTVYLVGPGASTRLFLDALGLEGTLLGIDAALNGSLVGRDLSESEILTLIGDRPAALVVGVTGGQGCLFGRGNQPLSPKVLAQIPRDRITVLAAMDKLLAIQPPRLFVDTGDAAMDERLAGFWPVTTAPDRTVMMRVMG